MSFIEPEPGAPWDRKRWQAAYVDDVGRIASLLGSDGIAVTGRRVAVVDSNDGILALGIAQRLGPALVVGYDDAGCNTVSLGVWAGDFAGLPELPSHLRFAQTHPYALPGDPGSVDLAVWWEDIGARRDPVRMLREISRLLAPQAHVLLRVPAAGPIGLDELQHAILAAGLAPARVDPPGTTLRPGLEDRARALSGMITRGALVLAYQPG